MCRIIGIIFMVIVTFDIVDVIDVNSFLIYHLRPSQPALAGIT